MEGAQTLGYGHVRPLFIFCVQAKQPVTLVFSLIGAVWIWRQPVTTGGKWTPTQDTMSTRTTSPSSSTVAKKGPRATHKLQA